jgi:hypothetical protein
LLSNFRPNLVIAAKFSSFAQIRQGTCTKN